jgi:hypothetical protein
MPKSAMWLSLQRDRAFTLDREGSAGQPQIVPPVSAQHPGGAEERRPTLAPPHCLAIEGKTGPSLCHRQSLHQIRQSLHQIVRPAAPRRRGAAFLTAKAKKTKTARDCADADPCREPPRRRAGWGASPPPKPPALGARPQTPSFWGEPLSSIA